MLANAALKRFLSKAKLDDGVWCWEWQAGKHPLGYGQFSLGARSHLAHRVAYEHFRGPIPVDLELDHLCRVRHCVNPWHLEPVTHQENVRRGHNAIKTHCPHGHAYDDANTYIDALGHRHCRTCDRDGHRRRHRTERVTL